MSEKTNIENTDRWGEVVDFLPAQWEEKCRELGALRWKRQFDGPAALLRTMLIHLLEGCSLRETVVRANMANISDVSDVALLKRLNRSGEWFRWMGTELRQQWCSQEPQLGSLRIRIVDATHVSEPGSRGSDWRIHYAIDLATLNCTDAMVTDTSVGETFCNFSVDQPDLLFIADRGYGHLRGVEHIVSNGGNVLVRLSCGPQAPLYGSDGEKFDVLKHLRTLRKAGEVGEWDVEMRNESLGPITGRLCAVRKNSEATERAIRELKQTCTRKGKQVSKEALEAAKYVFVFTTLPRDRVGAWTVLELYRARWQIEVGFKRLKSLLGIGHLPKQNPLGAKAWLNGKLFCALLIETIIRTAELFSPWGLSQVRVAQPQVQMA